MYKLLLLIALPFSAFSQIIELPKPGPARLDGATVCLTVPVAARVRDSLNALPLARKENRQLWKAVSHYKQAADSSHTAYVAEVQSATSLGAALRNQQIETTRARLTAKQWKGKARRRGFLNWLGVAALAAGAALLVAH